jgi:hypothetical protein
MTKARHDERIDFADIVDRSRPEYSPNVWQNPQEYARMVIKSYRKDYWGGQPEHVEIWVEKDAIIGSIESLTDALGVTVRVGRGFVSTTKVHEVAQIISNTKKRFTVFYLGDHDPSGRGIESDLHERIEAYDGIKFTMRRLAIHASDIQKFHLPPLLAKESDTRTQGFLRRYQNRCVELDALPPSELRRRIELGVRSKLDQQEWNRAVEVEKVELESIQNFVKLWPR